MHPTTHTETGKSPEQTELDDVKQLKFTKGTNRINVEYQDAVK